MIQGRYTRLDFRVIHKERKEKTVKIATGSGGTKMKFEKVVVQVKAAGEALDGKQRGKTIYQTYQTIDIEDAKPDEVYSVVLRAIENASNRK